MHFAIVLFPFIRCRFSHQQSSLAFRTAPVDADLIAFFHDQLFCLKLLDGAADAFQAKACLISQILPAFADA